MVNKLGCRYGWCNNVGKGKKKVKILDRSQEKDDIFCEVKNIYVNVVSLEHVKPLDNAQM